MSTALTPHGFDRHDDAALAGLIHVAQIDAAVLGADLIRERIVGIRNDLGVTAKFEISGRVGGVEDEQRRRRVLGEVLRLLPRRVERHANLVVVGEEPHRRHLRATIGTHGGERCHGCLEQVSVRVGNRCHVLSSVGHVSRIRLVSPRRIDHLRAASFSDGLGGARRCGRTARGAAEGGRRRSRRRSGVRTTVCT